MDGAGITIAIWHRRKSCSCMTRNFFVVSAIGPFFLDKNVEGEIQILETGNSYTIATVEITKSET